MFMSMQACMLGIMAFHTASNDKLSEGLGMCLIFNHSETGCVLKLIFSTSHTLKSSWSHCEKVLSQFNMFTVSSGQYTSFEQNAS